MHRAEFAFPREDMTDQELVELMGLKQPIPGLVMKAPQLLALEYIQQNPKAVLSFDKGMGKTVTYLAVTLLSSAPRIVILCSKNAMATQRMEILKWFPQEANNFIIVNSPQRHKREEMWAQDKRIFICSPVTFLTDMGERTKSAGRCIPMWAETASYVCDEFHRYLRTRKSKLFELFKKVTKTCNHFIPSSGSAAGKGPQDTWAILRLTNGKKFSAYWRFVYDFCEIQEGHFGKTIGRVKHVPQYRAFISTDLIHRRKDLKDYPPKTRSSLDVEMEPWQKQAHDQLLKDYWLEHPDGEITLSPNVMASLIKIRQFLICPKTLSPSYGYGAGLEGIVEDFQESELRHAVLSTPFLDPIPWIEQCLNAQGISTWRLTGQDNLDADEQDRRIAAWTQKGGLIIQTIAYSQSYELPAARIMYMLGCDYDPENNAQAEDRIHRDLRVTPDPVDIYYVRNLGSYEAEVVAKLSENADNLYNAMNRPLSEVFRMQVPGAS